MLTPQKLFDFANTFARNAENTDKGTCYPTFREVARKFRVTHDQIEELCSDFHGVGYLAPIVGFRSGSGIGSYDKKGDWQVEAYND